ARGVRVALPAAPAVRGPGRAVPGGQGDRGAGGPSVGDRPDLRAPGHGGRRHVRGGRCHPRAGRGAVMVWGIILAAGVTVLACAKWHALILVVMLLLPVAGFARGTLFSALPSRRARWRIRFRCRPAPGFASLAELAFRWSRLAAVIHGRRVRP